MTNEGARRIALLTRLVEKAPGPVGRTALMKFMYFLTALRDVPLRYDFSLYSYGPFDSAVLEDIDYAARLGAIDVAVEHNAVGYGYQIRPAASADVVKGFDSAFVAKHEPDVDWVLGEFGHLNSAELELASTIVYVDREKRALNETDIVERVHQIKPHFTKDRILTKLRELRTKDLVSS
jgi:uncharacterized protein YwgA